MPRPTNADAPSPPKLHTLCGEAAAEQRVAQDLSRVAAGVFSEFGDRMRALVLVGSFARGEGSVLFLDGEPHADPGYQFLALFDRRVERERALLLEFSANWTRMLRTRVDVVAFDATSLQRVPRTLFWFHVGRMNHETLIGDPTAIFAVPALAPNEIHVDEPMRLMTEATVSLALATLERRPDPLVVANRLQLLSLACGDAVLLLRGAYDASIHMRAEALRLQEPCAGLSALYDDAIAYLSEPRPDADSRNRSPEHLQQLRNRLQDIQLELEAQRVGSPRDPEAYARHRWPSVERHVSPRLHAVRRIWSRAVPVPPLERLLRAAVALVYDHQNEAARVTAARVLHNDPSVTGDEQLQSALRALAERVLLDPVGHPFAHWRTQPQLTTKWLLQRIAKQTSSALS